MALVKYGGGIVGASGSIAGTTHARNRFGNYIRSRTKPVNPNTQRQANVRQAMQYLSNYWSAVLSSENRLLWSTYAAAIAMKNRLGETVYLTGFNHFIRANIIWYMNEATVKATGPSELTLPATAGSFTITATSAGQSISFGFNETEAWALEAGSRLWLFEGIARGATRLFFNGPWRYSHAVAGVAETGAESPSIHASHFGFAAGQLITGYGRVQRADGRISEPFIATCTAT